MNRVNKKSFRHEEEVASLLKIYSLICIERTCLINKHLLILFFFDGTTVELLLNKERDLH